MDAGDQERTNSKEPSDEELVLKYVKAGHFRPLRIGITLGRVVALGLVVLAPVLALRGNLHDGWLIAGPALALGVCVLSAMIRNRISGRRALVERFRPDLDTALRSAREAVAGAPEPLLVVLFSGWVQPHGGSRWARVAFHSDAKDEARVEMALMDYRWEDDPQRKIDRTITVVDGVLVRQLFDLASAWADGGGAGETGFVKDGFPFELVLVGPTPDCVRRVEGNLSALEDPPVSAAVQLALTIADLFADLTGRRTMMGACDPHGNVRISEV